MKAAAAVTGCLFALCAVVLMLPLMWGVWLPDVVKPGAIVLDQLITTDGDHLRLTQLWVGDGYATEFFHTDKDGHIWTFAIDGDARKAWSGTLERTNRSLCIRTLETVYFYDVGSHVVTDRDGKPQVVEEIPRGTPIVPTR